MASRNDLFERLAADERGTAMTELVITLPVFLIIFAGVIELGKLTQQGVRVKAKASKNTWKKAMEIQKRRANRPTTQHGNPSRAGSLGRRNISNHPSPNGDSYARRQQRALISNGTAGEAKASTDVLRSTSTRPPGQPPGRNAGGDFPGMIIDDSRRNALSFPSGPLTMYSGSSAHSVLGPNQPFAAGIRYGMVVGQDSTSVQLPGTTYNLSAGYDVLPSPVSVAGTSGEHETIGFSRLSAADDSCLGNVLELSTDTGFRSNCR